MLICKTANICGIGVDYAGKPFCEVIDVEYVLIRAL
jgi:hypothetical protein